MARHEAGGAQAHRRGGAAHLREPEGAARVAPRLARDRRAQPAARPGHRRLRQAAREARRAARSVCASGSPRLATITHERAVLPCEYAAYSWRAFRSLIDPIRASALLFSPLASPPQLHIPGAPRLRLCAATHVYRRSPRRPLPSPPLPSAAPPLRSTPVPVVLIAARTSTVRDCTLHSSVVSRTVH